jgi:membrane-bound lytic murein transglycosylase D
MILAKDPDKYGFSERPEDPIAFDTVQVNAPIDLRLVAECSGVTLEEVKMLNPELNRSTTPKGAAYILRIPKNTKDTFVAEIASIPEEKWITWRKHEVRPGETLNTIASLYRTSINSIASANAFNQGGTLQVGQKLVIPIGRATPAVSYSRASYRSSSKNSKSSGTKKIVYKVKRGDTLYQIANLYDTDVDSIKRWNRIGSGEAIIPGDRLTIYRK